MVDSLADGEIVSRLRLLRSKNIGPVTYRQLLNRYGDAETALDAIPELAAKGRGRSITLANVDKIKAEIDQTLAYGARFLFLGTEEYPTMLSEMENAPACLIVKGNHQILQKPMISIVGARNASAAACRFGRSIAYELKELGYIVVSGLARGIDTAVHMGAGGGGTVAVIAGGIDISYPPENEQLQKRLTIDDLVIAEEVYGTQPRARHFPHRNRIIAGLSRGTLVVEAAPRSGSLITARIAGELGREAMAIPGSPLDPRSQGCNILIREGATLVQNASDITELTSVFDDSHSGQNSVSDDITIGWLGKHPHQQ